MFYKNPLKPNSLEETGIAILRLLLFLTEFGNLRLISDDDIPSLLEESLESQYTRLDDITVSFDNKWIRQVWRYLQEKDLEKYDHLPVLPCPHDDVLHLRPLHGNYVCEKVEGFPPAPSALSAALGHLGVHVVASLPDFVVHHNEVLHSRVQPASRLGVLKSLGRLAREKTGIVDAAVSRFNTGARPDERFALVEILAAGLTPGHEEEMVEGKRARDVLRRLELFPVWPECLQKDMGTTSRRHEIKGAKRKAGEFQQNPAKFTSVQDNCHMVPDVGSHTLPPPSVMFSPKLIHCESKTSRQFASYLGATEMPLKNLVQKILAQLSRDDPANSDVKVFMRYFLDSPLFEDEQLKCLAKCIRFIPTLSVGLLRRVDELYNPKNSLLQDLFADEDRFPSRSFYQSGKSLLQSLKVLGLRDAATVRGPDLIAAATMIDKYCRSRKPEYVSIAKQKARALWEFLMEHSGSFPQDVILQLANLRCLPCLTARENAPADYPAAVPVCPEEYRNLGIARLTDICDHSKLMVVGAVKPVALVTVHKGSLCPLLYQPTSDNIIRHLEIVTSKFTKKQSHRFALMLHLIYSSLKQKYEEGDKSVKEHLKNMNCILTEEDGHFRRPCEFWVQDDNNDLDLSPYRFPLPSTLADEGFSEFFVACGCSPQQNSDTLKHVLREIQIKHTESRHSKDCKRDLSLVRHILKAIVKKEEFEKGEVLLPVYSCEEDVLQLALAKDCTVAPDPNVIELLSLEETMTVVHPDLKKNVALKLGALDLKSRTLSGVDDFEIDDSSYGQHEPLTIRLHNLLQDGYTDGFSIPKVGITCFFFL